jgi:hypothetical protein
VFGRDLVNFLYSSFDFFLINIAVGSPLLFCLCLKKLLCSMNGKYCKEHRLTTFDVTEESKHIEHSISMPTIMCKYTFETGW